MTPAPGWQRHVGALGIMALGVIAVFAALLGMNAGEQPKRELGPARVVDFQVAKRRRPPPPKRVQPERRVRPQARPRAPLPNLALDLSAVDLGIPEFSAAGLDELSNSLVGAQQALDDMVMTDSAVDVPPRPMLRPEPAYPVRARAKGITGHVTLEFLIDQRGQVRSPQVTEAAPNGVFEAAALEAVRQWRFTPARYKGRATRVKRRLTLRFELA